MFVDCLIFIVVVVVVAQRVEDVLHLLGRWGADGGALELLLGLVELRLIREVGLRGGDLGEGEQGGQWGLRDRCEMECKWGRGVCVCAGVYCRFGLEPRRSW